MPGLNYQLWFKSATINGITNYNLKPPEHKNACLPYYNPNKP
ncbi:MULTISPECIES: hypothetical protein [Pontibacter]|nr:MULTISPECIES: hypothetical protein [Pontibacter]